MTRKQATAKATAMAKSGATYKEIANELKVEGFIGRKGGYLLPCKEWVFCSTGMVTTGKAPLKTLPQRLGPQLSPEPLAPGCWLR